MDPHVYCQEKAAASGSSFYYSFRFLPPERRRAITAFYAFCREVDDVVDECHDPAIAATKLVWWRQEVERVATGQPQHPVGQALQAAGKQNDVTIVSVDGTPMPAFSNSDQDLWDVVHYVRTLRRAAPAEEVR